MFLKDKILIIVGGNSRFAKHLVRQNSTKKKFDKVFLFSGSKKNEECIRKTDQFVSFHNYVDLADLLTQLNWVSASNSKSEILFIFAGTPTEKTLYDDSALYLKALTGVLALSTALYTEGSVKFLIIGSSLIFVPFVNRSKYKYIKRFEYRLFLNLRSLSKNIGYIVCHPIRPVSSLLGKLVSISVEELEKEILDNSCLSKTLKARIYTGSWPKKMLAKIFVVLGWGW